MKAHFGLHRLMYGLLFPAVLGTIFVVFINNELTHWSFNQRSFFGIVFITHWRPAWLICLSVWCF